jgi:inositol phosphorylceramide mannosyltransferase catalytic subunit
MLIPRVFHQIWVGPDPFPEDLAAHQETWLRHHPGWKLRFWTEENLPEGLERKEAYERLRQPAERADVLRLELLHREGGVYVDVDFECLRSIELLIDGAECFTGYRKPRRVNNAIIGSISGHPLLTRAIREIRPRSTYGPVDKAGTGPLFWRKLLRDEPGITIFEPDVFYPRTPEAEQHAYARHHQARTWQHPKTLGKRLAGAERLLREAQDEVSRLQSRCEQAEAELARLEGMSSPSSRVRRLFAGK